MTMVKIKDNNMKNMINLIFSPLKVHSHAKNDILASIAIVNKTTENICLIRQPPFFQSIYQVSAEIFVNYTNFLNLLLALSFQ